MSVYKYIPEVFHVIAVLIPTELEGRSDKHIGSTN
jgi:hypothetical protein